MIASCPFDYLSPAEHVRGCTGNAQVGELRVLTICSDQQMGEHSSHLAQPPRGPACNRDVAVLPAAPDQSGYSQTGAQLLRANAESVQRPSLCDPMLPRGGPALLSAGLCSPPSLPPPHTNHRFPTLQGSRLSAESSRAGRSRSPALSSLTGPSGQVRGPAGRRALSMWGAGWA